MSQTRTCPRCQTSFSADILDAQVGGVCPRCLFQLVIGDLGEEVTLKAPSTTPTVAESAPDLPKHMGNYEILGMLGAGGMGKVYKAKQRGLDRFVAIKVLGGGGQEEIERFFREARASAKLHHPNIIPIHEVVSHEGRYFYAMDFVDGKTLERAVKDGGLPLRQGLGILAKSARAIHFAHEHGVVHRDIKPANILLDGRGEPMVADFGLAKDISSEAGLTQSGYLLGTPSYMPPEQAAPDRKAEVDAQSDVYSLGATLYYVLTGRPPHEGRSVYEVIAKVVGNDPAPPRSSKPEIPRDVETICLKALRRDRASRYGSAKELAEDIDRYLAGEPILARPIGLAESLALKAKRHRRPIAIGALVAGLLVAASILVLRSRPALVDIVTDPAGAAVVVNGTPMEGTTPLAARRFPAGAVKILVEREGYRPETRTLTLSPGTTQELRISLARITGRLTLDTAPEGGVARLTGPDGVVRQVTCPIQQLELPAGVHSIRIEKSGFLHVVESVRVDPERETVHSWTLLSRELGRFTSKDGAIRDLLLHSWGSTWGILTQETRYEWMSSSIHAKIPELNPRFLPAGAADLLAFGHGFKDAPIMLVKMSDQAIEGWSRFEQGKPAWTGKLSGAARFTAALAVETPGTPSDFILAAVRGEGGDRRTEIHRVGAADGKLRWTRELRGHHSTLTVGPDVNGDGQGELVAWGDGAIVLSGADGTVLREVEETPGSVRVAGLRRGTPVSLLLATSKRLSSRDLASGKLIWEKLASGTEWEGAVLQPVAASEDLIVVSGGGLVRIDGGTGSTLWTRKDLLPASGNTILPVDLDQDGIADLVLRGAPGRLDSISGRSGETLWEFPLDARLKGTTLRALGSVEWGGRVIKIAAAFPSGVVLELDPSLTPLHRSIPNRNEPRSGWAKSANLAPLTAEAGRSPDFICFQRDQLVRLSLESGLQSWSVQLAGAPRELILFEASQTAVLVIPKGNSTVLQGRSIVQGAPLWERVLADGVVEFKAVPRKGGGSGLLVQRSPEGGPQTLTFMDPATGADRWSRSAEAAQCFVGAGDPGIDEIVTVAVDHPSDPLHPDLNGIARILSLEDGRLLRTHRIFLRPAYSWENALPLLHEFTGDGVPDLLVLLGGWIQLIDGASGKVVWGRVMNSFTPKQLFVRTEAGASQILLTGVDYSVALNGADGEDLWERDGRLVRVGTDGWLNAWYNDTNSYLDRAAHLDPLTGLRKDEAFMVHGESMDPSVFTEAFAVTRTDSEYQVTALRFGPPGQNRMRRASKGAVSSLQVRDQTHYVRSRVRNFADTPEGAALGFLQGLKSFDSGLIRRLVRIDDTQGWLARELLESLSERGRDDLSQWLRFTREGLSFQNFAGISVASATVREGEAEVILSAPAGPFGKQLKARLIGGHWTIVLTMEAPLVRALFLEEKTPTSRTDVVGLLKALCSAEADFKQNDRDQDGINAFWTGDVAGLYFQRELRLIEIVSATADAAAFPWPGRAADAKPVPHLGYYLRAMTFDPRGRPLALDLNRDGRAGENIQRFGFCAYPAEYPATGKLTFIVSEGNRVWSKETQGKPVDRFPEDPAKEGWSGDN